MSATFEYQQVDHDINHADAPGWILIHCPFVNMSTRSSFDETFKQAVTPGPGRLLAGVALAAAGRGKRGIVRLPIFVFQNPRYRSAPRTEKQTTSGYGSYLTQLDVHAQWWNSWNSLSIETELYM